MDNNTKNILTDLQGDKYTSQNPIAKKLLHNFFQEISNLLMLMDKNRITTMTECGCGKGQVTQFISNCIKLEHIKSFDISLEDLQISENDNDKDFIQFYQKSIYEITEEENADLIVCCEVLEHLEYPDKALKKMSELKGKYYLFSVPNEPIWRVLNFMRGKYMSNWGNTPDHCNHWSTKQFIKFVEQYLEIIEVRRPLPWTMILAKPKI